MAVPLCSGRNLLAVVIAVSWLPASAHGDDRPGHDRWVPSIAVTSGISMVSLDGSVESFDGMGGELRPPVSGRGLDTSPLLGGDLEIMTPQLPVPLSPRLFFSGEVGAQFTTQRDLAREGSATGATHDPLPIPAGATIPASTYAQDSLRGLGSEAAEQIQTLNLGAGFGVAIPFTFRDRPMLFKTSAEYLTYEVSYSGRVTSGQCLPLTATDTTCVTWQRRNLNGPVGPVIPGYQRNILLQAPDTTTRYHAIGPAIELEMETGDIGPFTHALYIGARGYRTLGDRAARSTELTASESYSDPIGDDAYTADWDYKIDRWMYRVIVGLRFNYVGP